MSVHKVLRAVIWVAVSSKRQALSVKDSLPTQEAEALAICEQHGWQVIEILRVPGHSRRYTSLEKCAADMRSSGINAFDRLMALWEQRAFDVLICRDGNRFGRTQSLHNRVVEDTINSGAIIYSLTDGEVNRVNYRMWNAFNGYKAAIELDEMKKVFQLGQAARIKKGLPSSRAPFGYRLLRDEYSGKALHLAVDEGKRPLFTALAELLMQRVKWTNLGVELEARYGFINPNTGHSYKYSWGTHEILNPYFWGNAASHYYRKLGTWVFDEAAERPQGISIYYGTHTPVWQGWVTETIHVEDLKAELRLRVELCRGKRRRERNTILFSGLMRCGECGVALRSEAHGIRFRCCTKYYPSRLATTCTQSTSIRSETVRVFINELIQHWISARLFGDGEESDPAFPNNGYLLKQIENQETILRTLIRQRAGNPELAYLYDAELDAERVALAERRRTLRTQTREAEKACVHGHRLRFLVEYGVNMDKFWQLTPDKINAELFHLFGQNRLTVKDGTILSAQ